MDELVLPQDSGQNPANQIGKGWRPHSAIASFCRCIRSRKT